MLNCSHTGLLCKHYFAVFEHNEERKQDGLPKNCQGNPHLSLDNAVIFRSTRSLKPDSITDDPTDPPLPTFVSQTQVTDHLQKLKGLCQLF